MIHNFDVVSKTYDEDHPQMFSVFGQALVDASKPVDCTKVLDIACGKGAITLPLSSYMTHGTIIGFDLSLDMLKVLQAKNNPNIRIIKADAHAIPVCSDTFNKAYIGFSVFYFNDPEKVLGEVNRVLVPGGEVFLSSWAEEKLFSPIINDLMNRKSNNSKLFVLHEYGNPDDCRHLLYDRGFCDIQIKAVTIRITFRDEEHWWDHLWTHGMRLFFETLNSNELAEIKSKALPILRKECFCNNILSVPIQAIFSSAKKPKDRRNMQ
jgi:ubiquinone/menaquinone biosynthesis C-methylase UbiE